ncbi:helix-turn-helix domain-containing protein [Candidatus Synechococcus calcipolaris G9]|uniref:Helix-turn-helix domain-containing protein n=1 Tax=Candidatus Synechococcus calcipolaris G9 TaxID=1497997 RepID=A0ABT6EXM8_9SYNE|nr:helix-turn-helix transcriptional regulator [Candidatus Synechococcus calcipolaris]MDG2990556.1 helix-turn-helix domain-containing protein [Candidatus Synechococcus calcipolaris G9]
MNLEAKQRLGILVRKTRSDRSLREFARLVGVAPTTIQGWENGDYIPEIDNLAKIAALAGLTLEELIAYVENREVIEPKAVDRIVHQIRKLPISEVAIIVKVGADRLASVALGS